jgi:hypothetical protein
MIIEPAWAGFLDHDGIVHDRAPTRPHPSAYVGARCVHESDLPALLTYRGPLRIAVDRVDRVAVELREAERFRWDVRAFDVPTPGRLRHRLPPLPASVTAYAATSARRASRLGIGVDVDLDVADPARHVREAVERDVPFSMRGGDVVTAVEHLRLTAEAAGVPGDLAAARRWCRSWRCRDVDAAIAYLDLI